MAQAIADVLPVNMEVVRKQLPALYELNQTAYGLLSKSAEKFRISKTPNAADFRCPIKTQPPAGFGTFSMAGGSLTKGSGFKAAQFTQTYFPMVLPVDVNYDVMVATSGGANLSVVNAWKENLKEAIPSFQRLADAAFHNQGGSDGVLAVATGYSAGVVTCADGTFGSNLIQVGQPLEIVDAAGTTHLTYAVTPDSLPYVSAVDKGAGTFTITNLGSVSPNQTDKYIIKGAVTDSSGSTVSAIAWANGLYYFHTTDSSGNMLNLAKASYDIMPNLVNAAGKLAPTHAWQLKAKIRQRRGTVSGKYKGLIHDAQAAQVRALGLAISEIQIPNGGSLKNADVASGVGDTIMFGDVEHLIDVHQNKTRIDWLLPSENWCRVYGQELDFFKSPEGKMIFEARTTSGTTAAGFSFYLVTQENSVCVDPGKEGAIYGLTVDSGF